MASSAHRVRTQPATSRSLSKFAQSRSTMPNFSIGREGPQLVDIQRLGLSQSLRERQQDIVVDYARRIRQPARHDAVNTRLAFAGLMKLAQQRRTQRVPQVGDLGFEQRMVVFQPV